VARENKIPDNTIRISCSVEVPHDQAIMNYGDISRKILLNYIKDGGYYVVENGPNKRSTGHRRVQEETKETV
tara:strand:+ start:153 stop:368 length:216 start_codon:yes stop_codon:yes gene_type:complete